MQKTAIAIEKKIEKILKIKLKSKKYFNSQKPPNNILIKCVHNS